MMMILDDRATSTACHCIGGFVCECCSKNVDGVLLHECITAGSSHVGIADRSHRSHLSNGTWSAVWRVSADSRTVVGNARWHMLTHHDGCHLLVGMRRLMIGVAHVLL